jgi:hypothetical protein
VRFRGALSALAIIASALAAGWSVQAVPASPTLVVGLLPNHTMKVKPKHKHTTAPVLVSNLAVCPITDTHAANGIAVCDKDWSASAFFPQSELVCTATVTGGNGKLVSAQLIGNGVLLAVAPPSRLTAQPSNTYLQYVDSNGVASGPYSCEVTVSGTVTARLPFTVGPAIPEVTKLALCPGADTINEAGSLICSTDWSDTPIAGIPKIVCSVQILYAKGGTLQMQFLFHGNPWYTSPMEPIGYANVIWDIYTTSAYAGGGWDCQIIVNGTITADLPFTILPSAGGG